MKKSILILSAIFSFALLFTACKESKKEDAKTESHDNHEGHDHSSEEMASKDVYQCPMDCEKGKTYEAEGSCPVCKMDLKTKSLDTDVKHAEGCKCLEGGECKCEDGKCTCQKEMAKMKKECTMCESGSCDCKA